MAPFLAQAAGAGVEYGVCGAVAAACGAGAVPFALETREAPTVVALSGVAATAWGAFTAWSCWADTTSVSRLAIGALFTAVSGAAGAVVAWRREGSPIERTKLEIELTKLEMTVHKRDELIERNPVPEDAELSLAELPEHVWKEPSVVPGTTDPIDVGGGIRIPLEGGHIIIGGATGAGKSVFLAGVIANLLPREHMRVVVIDPKGDALLGMLRNSAVTMVDDDKTAERVMAEMVATMVRRGDMVRAAASAYTLGEGPCPTESWVPTAEEPWWVVVVDEFTDYAGSPVMECIVEMARKSRALGQTLVLATQALDAALFKSEKSASGGGPRSQFSTRVAGRLENSSETEKVFGERQDKTWPAHLLPGQGHVLVRSAIDRVPVVRRAPYIDMPTLAAWARKCSGVGAATPFIPAQRDGGRHLALVPTGPPATQEETVMAFLDANGSSSVDSIHGGTGIAKSSLRTVLSRLAKAECVVKDGSVWKPL